MDSNIPDKIKNKTYDIIYYILVVVEIILFLRFLFRLFGANPNSGFVAFLYSISYVLVGPFIGMFPTVYQSGSVFEPYTVVAMIVYAIAATIIVWLIKLITEG